MSSDHYLDSVHFRRKLLFSASQHLVSTRSFGFSLPHSLVGHTDLWNIKPPDFSPKLYQSSKISQIRNKIQTPLKLKAGLSDILPKSTKVFPELLLETNQKAEPPTFLTWYRPPDSLESTLLFVKTGKYPSSVYKDPKPYDFRPLNDDMPSMVTTTDKDAGHLNFKSKLIDLHARSEPKPIHLEQAKKVDTFKKAEPKWDAKLVLPKTAWPPKSASYTRHRRKRAVHSAFMDRVEEKFNALWKK